MLHDIFDILRNALLITGLVMVMMLLIEYINVVSQGERLQSLKKSRFRQVVVAALLALIPGCVGGFAVVSLFTHGVVNFGALTAAMIAALGDESFVMLASMPTTALLIMAIVFVLAVVVGCLVNVFVKKSPSPCFDTHLEIHSHDVENVHGSIAYNLKHLSLQRAVLLIGIILFILGLISGFLGHDHDHDVEAIGHAHECCHHAETNHLNFLLNESWINLLFAAVSVIALYIIAKVNDHFLEDHLWGHIIKKHFCKIFLWTLGALLLVYFLLSIVDIREWIGGNLFYVLLIALLIGIIPQSGPHILFIVLFLEGSIPFSILLANSIVQDGHACLPLLAESKRSFVYIKLIKLALGLIVGTAGYLIGF